MFVAASDWPSRFPTRNKVVCTYGHHYQSVGGTSIGWSQQRAVDWGSVPVALVDHFS